MQTGDEVRPPAEEDGENPNRIEDRQEEEMTGDRKMAKKPSVKKTEPQAKPVRPQVPARLLAAVRTVLEDADDTGRKNTVVVGATAYNALRNVLHDLTGQWWGMAVEERDDEEDEDEEIDDERDEDEDDE
jgi:hypothetical protein